MKISEIRDEAALDSLADIIEPCLELFADKDIVATYKGGNKGGAIRKAIKNHKKAVIGILAGLDGVPVEEYHCNIFSLPIKLLEILNDKELISFLSLQGETQTSSESHSESIQEDPDSSSNTSSEDTTETKKNKHTKSMSQIRSVS